MFHFAFLFWNIMEHLEHYAQRSTHHWFQKGYMLQQEVFVVLGILTSQYAPTGII